MYKYLLLTISILLIILGCSNDQKNTIEIQDGNSQFVNSISAQSVNDPGNDITINLEESIRISSSDPNSSSIPEQQEELNKLAEEMTEWSQGITEWSEDFSEWSEEEKEWSSDDSVNMMKDLINIMPGGSMTQQESPKISLQNLLIKNFGPYYDAYSKTFGDIIFNENHTHLVFDEFGRIHNEGQQDQYYNPNFEIKAPADTVLISPIDGVITYIKWQPTEGYTQDDWEIIIKPTMSSNWGISIDHITSIDCDRKNIYQLKCPLPLKIDGQEISEGSTVKAGQVIGYVGNWDDYNNSGINGRTELTVFEQIGSGHFMNHCPMLYLDDMTSAVSLTSVISLMFYYEQWSENTNIYDEDAMVRPGCIYESIEELNGITTPR